MGLAELMGIEGKKGGGFLPGFTVERGCWAVFALLLCGCVSGALSVGGTLCDGCSARRAWLVVPLLEWLFR